MTYNLIIILLEFKFLSKCKLFTAMKELAELVVKGNCILLHVILIFLAPNFQ